MSVEEEARGEVMMGRRRHAALTTLFTRSITTTTTPTQAQH